MPARKEQRRSDAKRDRTTTAHAIEPHRFRVVPTASVEVDARLWDAVRLAVPAAARKVGPTEGRVFPVVERNGRLVLLAFFEEFLALAAAGATSVSVWPAEFGEWDDLVQYAVAFSIR